MNRIHVHLPGDQVPHPFFKAVFVEQVAQENNFQLIFDTSMFNAVLFAAESEDVMPMVKAKLGITDEEK